MSTSIYDTAKVYVEGFNSYVIDIKEDQNPYPMDGEKYHQWWDGWVDAAENVVEYYKIAKGIINSSCKQGD